MRRALLLAPIILAMAIAMFGARVATAHASCSGSSLTAEYPLKSPGTQNVTLYAHFSMQCSGSWTVDTSVNAYSAGYWHIVSGTTVHKVSMSGSLDVQVPVTNNFTCAPGRLYRTAASAYGTQHYSQGIALC